MHDMERIRRHFMLTRRPTEVTMADVPPMFRSLMNPFVFEGYMIWDRATKSTMSFKQLMTKPEFEKWVYGHLLKICLPFSRPLFSGSPVHSPLNLTALIRFMIAMFEVGYPAHWLQTIFSRICTGSITTTARPPTSLVSKPAHVDAKRPAKEICVQPWVAEFTTLLSIWRRLLPFGIDSLGGSLVSLETIHQYSITFPPFRAEQDRIPHFMLLFWNIEEGYTQKPPASMYNILSDGGGEDILMPTKSIREKGVVCVTAFHYTSVTRTAKFWMRADIMERMVEGKWKVFIWRTDTWTGVTDGVDVTTGVAKGQKWAMKAENTAYHTRVWKHSDLS